MNFNFHDLKYKFMESIKFKKQLRAFYNKDDDPTDDPSKASNTYSDVTILNAKNQDLCDRTNNIITRVYTQDLYNQHEDRFMFALTTMMHLKMIKEQNPNHRFISEIIVPPGELIHRGYERLLENTLCQISDAFVITIFGGSVFSNDDNDENMYPIILNNDTPGDLAFVISNMVMKVPAKIFIFNQLGTKQHYESFKSIANDKLKLFDYSGNILNDFMKLENKYTKMVDNTQPTYNLSLILGIMCEAFRQNKTLKYADINVAYNNDIDNKSLPKWITIMKNRIQFDKWLY